MGLGEFERQPQCDGESNHQGNRHAHAGVDRDRAHVRAHQAAHEGHRQQGRDHSEGGQNGWPTHLVDRARDGDGQRILGLEAPVPVDVFDHHGGVVDQDADGEDEREQRNAVQREAPGPAGEQGRGEREDHRCADDDRLAPTQRQAHQNDHAAGGKDEFLDQLVGFVGLVGCGLAMVAGDGHFHVFGDHGVAQGVQALAHTSGHIHRVFTRLLGHGDRHRRVALALLFGVCRVGRAGGEPHTALRQLRARFHPRHLAQIDWPALADADHDVTHVFRVLQELARLHTQQVRLAGRGSGVGDRPRGHGLIRGRNRTVQRLHAHTALALPVRLQPHMHRAARAADGDHLARAG